MSHLPMTNNKPGLTLRESFTNDNTRSLKLRLHLLPSSTHWPHPHPSLSLTSFDSTAKTLTPSSPAISTLPPSFLPKLCTCPCQTKECEVITLVSSSSVSCFTQWVRPSLTHSPTSVHSFSTPSPQPPWLISQSVLQAN